MSSTYLFLFLLINTKFGQPPEYSLVFSKIDNRVEVFVGDSAIFDSQSIDHSPGLEYLVNLTPFLSPKSRIIKVVLYNGHPPYYFEVDPLWEVRFELMEGNQELDFFYESGDDNAIGKVLELEINIDNY